MAETSPYTLITGASSGIGRAITVRLARARLTILHGRDAGRLEQSRQACGTASKHLVWSQDLRPAAKVAAGLAEFLAEEEVGVDGVVHYAGMVHVLSARSASFEAVQESLNVNYAAAQQIIATLLSK